MVPTELLPELMDVPMLGGKLDPVANAARLASDRILAYIATLPADKRGTTLSTTANLIRPDGASWLNSQAVGALRAGGAPGESLRSSLAALVANSYANMLMTGKLPSYSGTSGLGVSFSDVFSALVTTPAKILTDTAKGLICVPEAGKDLGNLIKGETGAKVGNIGQSALQNVVGCAPGFVPGGNLAQTGSGEFPWGYIVLGVGVLLGIGGVVYFMGQKR